jgi:hypothetical protein
MSKKKQILFIYTFLAAATLIAFWQVNHCKFIICDDGGYVTKNGHIQGGITLEGIRWAFTTGYAANWHPVTWISHMLDVQLFRLEPWGHHLTNLLFHIANTLLLFLVFHRMSKAVWQSAFVAALFGLHPLHVESVAWVAERKDVLSTFFWMLTMAAYCYYVERPALQRYLHVLLLFVLGLMAKPMLVTLPFVLLLLDYWPLKRFEQRKSSGEIWTKENGPGSREKQKGEATAEGLTDYKYQWALIRPLLLEKIPLVSLAALSSVITYIAQQEGGAVRSTEVFSLSIRIANAFVSYIIYIGKMFWPGNLAAFYPHPGLWPLWQVIAAVLLLVAVTWMVIWRAKRSPYLLTGWFWYLGILVPVIGLVQVGSQARADRYTYIPLIGLFIIGAWGISELLKGWRFRKEALILLPALSLLCLSIATWTQVKYWRDSIMLFEHALKVTDPKSTTYNHLGNAYSEVQNYRQAIRHYAKAIELNPRYAEAYYNQGIAYWRLGKYRQAIARYDNAIELNPKYAEAYNNRAVAYGGLGNYRQAIEDCERAVALNPKMAEAYHNRAVAYGGLGDPGQAIEDLKTAARLGHEGAQNFLRGQGINW